MAVVGVVSARTLLRGESAESFLQRGLLAQGSRVPEPSASEAEAKKTFCDTAIAVAVSGLTSLSRRGDLLFVLDGRVFNLGELAGTLGLPADSSTEDVLSEGYRRWGEGLAEQLSGDFALLVWDAAKRRLLIMRDVAGARPVHYLQRGDELWFATDARGVLAALGEGARIDEEKVAHWLLLQWTRSNNTFFQDVKLAPSGQVVTFAGGRVTLRDFWRPEEIPLLHLRDGREYAEGLREVLTRAVADRVAGWETHAGSQLSGGLDSSSVASLAAKTLAQTGHSLTAFTAVPEVPIGESSWPGKFLDERDHAAAVAAAYPNIRHEFVPNMGYRIFPVLDLMSSAYEQPALNPNNLPWIYGILEGARRSGLRLLLHGQAGNMGMSWDGSRALPSLIRRGHWAEAWRMARAQATGGRKLRSVFSYTARQLAPPELHRLLSRQRPQTPTDPALTGMRAEFARQHGLAVRGLASVLSSPNERVFRKRALRRADVGAFASGNARLAGVDYADPTADRRVLEYCLAVPEEQYCEGGVGRSLIRDAMRGIVPEVVLRERRKGLQSADFLAHMAAEREEFAAELRRMREHELLRRALDLPMLDELMRAWSGTALTQDAYVGYSLRLSRAVSLGRFVRRVEEGTLFAPMPDPEPIRR